MDQLDHLIGSEIGKYTVINVLGQGSMGVVLHARDNDTDNEVAIKLLAPELVRDEVSRERMSREARALSKMSHPNIVTTYEFDTLPNGRAYLVMEYVKGENLDDYLEREKTLPVKMTIILALQVSNGMAFAHDEGIIHRDLKPQNIMLQINRGRLTCKILDFGIAKMVRDRKKLTGTGEVVGSPIFMSPEQCTGKKLDQRTDIYSLGIVLYKCLTGKYPHRGSTLRDTFVMKTTLPPPRIKEINPEYDGPPQLENVVYKCLEIKPEDRYRTMADVYLALRELARDYNLLDTVERARPEEPVVAPAQAPASPGPTTEVMMKLAKSRNLETSSGLPVKKLLVLSVIALLIIIVLVLVSLVMPKVQGTKHEAKRQNQVESARSIIESKPEEKVVEEASRIEKQQSFKERQVESSPESSVSRKQKSRTAAGVSNFRPPAAVNKKKTTRDQEHDAWWKYRLKNEN